jgi:hypothetical protein
MIGCQPPGRTLSYPGGATLEQAASDKHYLMKPPADGKGLAHYRFTRRQKEKILFDAEMTVYVCCRYENQKGEVGQSFHDCPRGYSVSAEVSWSFFWLKSATKP